MEPNTQPRRGQPRSERMVYYARCRTCKFMRSNPAFRLRAMQSKYFSPGGHESLADVVHSYGDPMSMPAIYQHMDRHQQRDVIKAQKLYAEAGVIRQGRIPAASALAARDDLQKTVGVIEQASGTTGIHEMTLDEFIAEGREKLTRREMSITASNLLQAIKIKSDIDKGTKDRRLEMIKSFFAGGEKREDDAAPS